MAKQLTDKEERMRIDLLGIKTKEARKKKNEKDRLKEFKALLKK